MRRPFLRVEEEEERGRRLSCAPERDDDVAMEDDWDDSERTGLGDDYDEEQRE